MLKLKIHNGEEGFLMLSPYMNVFTSKSTIFLEERVDAQNLDIDQKQYQFRKKRQEKLQEMSQLNCNIKLNIELHTVLSAKWMKSFKLIHP